MRPSTLVAAKLVTILAFGGGCLFLALQPRPVGPLTSELVCRWDVESTSYQTFIVYRRQGGEEVGVSEAAGWCQP